MGNEETRTPAGELLAVAAHALPAARMPALADSATGTTRRTRVGDRDTLRVFAFGSHDYLGTVQTNNGQPGPIVEQLGSDFHKVDLRYRRALVDGGG